MPSLGGLIQKNALRAQLYSSRLRILVLNMYQSKFYLKETHLLLHPRQSYFFAFI